MIAAVLMQLHKLRTSAINVDCTIHGATLEGVRWIKIRFCKEGEGTIEVERPLKGSLQFDLKAAKKLHNHLGSIIRSMER